MKRPILAGIKPQQFIHKKTGEIVTQVPISQIADYEKYYGVCNGCGYVLDQYGRCTAPLSNAD